MGSIDLLATLRAGGASLFNQQTRILKTRFPESSAIPEDTLLPHRLTGEEGLSRNPRYTLHCLSPFAHLELKQFMGQPIEISLLLADGGERLMTGVVTSVQRGPCDGGFCTYSLTVESALATLAHRRNSRNFQDKSAVEVVKAILDEHMAGNPVFAASFQYRDKLTKTYPLRSYCNQYRETDLAFIERLLAEEGITYRFSHGEDDDIPLRRERRRVSGNADNSPIIHTLILQDSGTQPPALEETIRFHRTDGVETADAIDSWESERKLQSGQTNLITWDYKSTSYLTANNETANPGGKTQQDLASTLEDYEPLAAYYGSDTSEIERYAELRQLAKDLAGKLNYGGGTTRQLAPGIKINLADHPVVDQSNPEDRQFVITNLQFEAQNNLTQEAQTALGSLLGNTNSSDNTSQNQPPYRNTFTAVRQDTAIVPTYQSTRHQKPTEHATTTATVVCPNGEEIHTDQYGRIKVQFHWQRKQDHPNGGADWDDRSSTWVRMAMPSADAQWGHQFIPRKGTELVIAFLNGDIDRPIAIGVVYNGSHMPPTFSGAGHLPANKALSGIKTKEYKGGSYNELLFDDSTGQMRAKLSSEHGKTQLNQGYLIHPRTEGKGTPRGDGFELRTDLHGAIRAAHGLLLTTEGQAGAGGRQLARDLATQQLNAAYELAKNLGEIATKQYADTLEHGPQTISPENEQESKTQSGHLKHHLEALKAWETGTNTDQNSGSKSNTDAEGEAGCQPIMVLSSPAGIAEITNQNHSTSAKANIDQIAGRDLNQTSGRRWLHNVGQHISLFVNGVKDKISMKLIAAQGKVQLQAQHGEMELTAEQNLHITSTQKQVMVAAEKEVLLTSGGGYIRIAGGNIDIHCPGIVSIKGASHRLTGPTSMTVPMPQFPLSLCKDCLMKAAQAGSPFAALQ